MQGLLRAHAVGDVAAQGENGLHRSLGVRFRDEPPTEDRRPLLAFEGELGLEGCAAFEYTPDGILPEPALRIGQAKFAQSSANALSCLQANRLADVVGDEQAAPLPVKAQEGGRQAFEWGSAKIFARRQCKVPAASVLIAACTSGVSSVAFVLFFSKEVIPAENIP